MKSNICPNAALLLLGLLPVNAENGGLRRNLRVESAHETSQALLRNDVKCYTKNDELKTDIDRYLSDPRARQELGGKHKITSPRCR